MQTAGFKFPESQGSQRKYYKPCSCSRNHYSLYRKQNFVMWSAKVAQNKATVFHGRSFCKIHSTVKLGVAKFHKLHTRFWDLVLLSLKSEGILPLAKQRGGSGPNCAAICQNNQVTGNCSSKGRRVSKFQMPTWSWSDLHTLGRIPFSASTHSSLWC